MADLMAAGAPMAASLSPSRRYLNESSGLEFFGLLTLDFSPLNSSFKPRNAIAKRGVFLYNGNGIRRIVPAIKVAGGRTQRLYAESVCGQGFKRRAYKLL